MLRKEKEIACCSWFSPLPEPIKVTPQKSPGGTDITKVHGVRGPTLTPGRPWHPHDIVWHPADILALPLQISCAWRKGAAEFVILLPFRAVKLS